MRSSITRAVPIVLALVLAPTGLIAQASAPSFQEQIRAAEQPAATVDQLLAGSAAARTLKDFDRADRLWDSAAVKVKVKGSINSLVSAALSNELASSRGVGSAQRIFRIARERYAFTPVEVADWIAGLGFPEILVGGEYDAMIGSLSATAPDPRYRCACYVAKAWMHRVAGDMDKSRVYWDSAMTATASNPPAATAQTRVNRARDLARAGRKEAARKAAQEALAVDTWASMNGNIKRRWAQYYAEMGEMDKTIEILEELIAQPTLETITTIENRVSWDPVRATPQFQAFMARHR